MKTRYTVRPNFCHSTYVIILGMGTNTIQCRKKKSEQKTVVPISQVAGNASDDSLVIQYTILVTIN